MRSQLMPRALTTRPISPITVSTHGAWIANPLILNLKFNITLTAASLPFYITSARGNFFFLFQKLAFMASDL
jgi:hypothetical protein